MYFRVDDFGPSLLESDHVNVAALWLLGKVRSRVVQVPIASDTFPEQVVATLTISKTNIITHHRRVVRRVRSYGGSIETVYK